MRRAIRRFLVGRQGTAGSALIELALVVSMVFVLFVTVLDFGMGFYYSIEVQHAAQAGAEYVIATPGWTSAGISSAVTNATALSGISASVATPPNFCGCPSSTGIRAVTAGNCTQASCSTGTIGTYVTVSALYTYKPISAVTASSIFPLSVNSSIPLTASATVRIR